MAFVPSSTIWLCSVPFDNSYKNQVYFDAPAKQASYFSTHTKKTFSDYLVVRKTMPDGTLRSSVKVGANIDSLYGCNYMYYRNENHGTRLFYCFITDLVYINEGTTEIVFETDVYQTWRFDVDLLPSFVVREHSITDEIGENIVAEPFNFNDYVYHEVSNAELKNALNQWGYLIVCSEPPTKTIDSSVVPEFTYPTHGCKLSGVYQGLFFYYFTSFIDINKFIDGLTSDGLEGVLSITAIPSFNVSVARITSDTQWETGGYVYGTDYPAELDVFISEPNRNRVFRTTNNSYYANVKNNKLFTSQFYRLMCSNHSGQRTQYNVEDFVKNENGAMKFTMYGDISPSPSVAIFPRYYKGFDSGFDYCTSLGEFPQSSFLSDSYKLWLARNRHELIRNIGTGVAQLAGAIGLAYFTGINQASLSMGASGAHKIADTVVSCKKADMMPNISNVGNQINNLITGMGENTFTFMFESLKGEDAEIVDTYFTMFGYQTNTVKVPNVSSRPYFNYVQTIDVNIADPNFGIPCNDMARLKQMYNDGVTLWKSNATVGDYTVDNSPN